MVIVIFYWLSTKSCQLYRKIQIRVAVLFQVWNQKTELLLRGDWEAAGSHAGRQRAPQTRTVSFSACFISGGRKWSFTQKTPKIYEGWRRDEGVSSERSPWACPTASRQRQSQTPEMCRYHKIKALSGNKFILWSVLAPPKIWAYLMLFWINDLNSWSVIICCR